ncbi:MAG: M20/M25/M40 family metallo-hydrolase [Pyrinomonadaceae bacterium]|nr:M20/M25/M40 family metallo-hydrolase [Pyrinomonadaceae bacterium]
MKRIYIVSLTLIIAAHAVGQSTVTTSVRDYRQKNEHKILKEFFDLLSIPNVASDTKNIYRNANYLVNELKKRGLKPRLLTAADKKVPPAVYGEWIVPGAKRTVVFYAHYDGQPTDPNEWTGSRPWEPVLRSGALKSGGKSLPFPAQTTKIDSEWRVYARSASDDKGGTFTILKAIDALRAKNVTPSVNIKLFFEGEEEAGSSNLREIITKHKALLKSDGWIICDGPAHQSGKKQVVFGVRGVTSVDLTVYGANRSLHSGHYGNWSPNPGFRLVKLLNTMKDSDGRVLIDGWYDDVEPLSTREIEAINSAPQYDEELKKQLGLSEAEGKGKSLLELLNQPSLNINGMKTGNVGSLARNIIPSTANAVLGLRLVKGNDHKRQIEKLRKHIEKQGFYVIDREPTEAERLKYPLIAKFLGESGGYNAQRTKMDLPFSIGTIKAVRTAANGDIVTLPTLGGSLPLSIVTETLDDFPTITVPIANYDNNQHAADENIRIQNLWDGIEIFANLMTMEF